MLNVMQKLKEVTLSVLPIFLLVIISHFAFFSLEAPLLGRFIVGSFLIVIGLTLFLLGVDLGVTPLGFYLSNRLVKKNRLSLVLIVGFVLGFVITIAEPGLLVYANQIEILTQGLIPRNSLLIFTSIGVAVLMAGGFLRILYNVSLVKILIFLYGLIFIIAIFSQGELINIAFDASGATTGVLAVPFILSLTYGIAQLKKDTKRSEDDAFGTIAVVSAGAILSVLALNVFGTNILFSDVPLSAAILEGSIGAVFIRVFNGAFLESLQALIPLLIILFLSQALLLRFKMRQFMHMVRGFIYVFIGLTLFLVGIQGGFLDVGTAMGQAYVLGEHAIYFLLFAFILGVVTILAEPAVLVLSSQVNTVTSGYVSRRVVLVSLSMGVGLAVFISSLRVIIEPLQVWHFLLPGYIISLVLMRWVPKFFIGMAFDAGGVATGPMTATFILAFMYGASDAYPTSNVLLDGLGTIALVALTPIITLLCLGLIYRFKFNTGGPSDV